MATEYNVGQAFASVNFPLRVPCWNILSIGLVGGVNSLDVYRRVILRKGVNSYCTVSLRAVLSKPLVTCTLSCRCRGEGSELGVRFGFGFGFGFGFCFCFGFGFGFVLYIVCNASCSQRCSGARFVAVWFHKTDDSYGLVGYDVTISRPWFAHTFFSVGVSCTSPGKIIQDKRDLLSSTVNVSSPLIFSPSPFVSSPKRCVRIYSSSLAFAGKYSGVTGATSSTTCSTCTAGTCISTSH